MFDRAAVSTLTAAAIIMRIGAVQAGQNAVPTPAPTIEVQKLGPQVGARVPDFLLTDQNGHTRTLASIMGPKGAMLVFFRSADW